MDSGQNKARYEDGREALRHVIENGKGYEKTAHHLWPSMALNSAYARLKKCTTAEGDQKLDFDEVILASLFNERYDALMHMCDRCLHERPKPRSPEERRDELMQRFNAGVEQLASIAKEIRETGNGLRVVSK